MTLLKNILFLFVAFFLIALMNQQEKKTIFLIGDSTMCEYDPIRAPLTGWGSPFVHFFSNNIKIDNRARGGRSTKTFINENRWALTEKDIREGDYVFIQFGHNDGAKEEIYKERYTPIPDYKANLVRFILETRAKKGCPVLVTPVARFKFDKSGMIQESHTEYSAAVHEVAKLHKVPLIDLDRKSRDLLQALGPDRSRLLFMNLEPGEHPYYPEGQKDNTHFNEYGARLIAQLVLEGIKELDLELSSDIISLKKKAQN
jgi:lysophospholipase L1-like esterase